MAQQSRGSPIPPPHFKLSLGGGTRDHHQGKSSNMEEKSIRIIPFSVEWDKWDMWSGNFLASACRLGYDIILRVNLKTLVDNKEEKTKEYTILKQLKKNAYNELILAQDDTVCFHIIE